MRLQYTTVQKWNVTKTHAIAMLGAWGIFRERVASLYCTFLFEKYLKVFVNKYSQSPEGGGKPQGVGGGWV